MEQIDFKKDFKILNKDFVYLDSGATNQHPHKVLKSVMSFYENSNANPHRGSYSLCLKATNEYENARHTVAKFLNVKSDKEIVFTKNASESLNLIAYGFCQTLNKDDEIVLSILEHHSMIVPFQRCSQKSGAKLKFMYLKDYSIDPAEISKKITKKTKVVGISLVSNVLGTIVDIESVIKKAHSVGAKVIVDISQSIAHIPFDVQKTDADFVVFSGHKMFAPLGIGVLYGKKELLDKMPPFLLGGDMIEYVYEQSATFAETPQKFEAGTQNVGGAVGLKSAIEYIEAIGYKNIQKIEKEVYEYAISELKKLKFVELYVSPEKDKRSSVISFNIKGVHSHDTASILDSYNVFVRSGNHCAQPLLRYLKLDSTCRASFSIYNTKSDVQKLVFAIKQAYEKFKKYIKE